MASIMYTPKDIFEQEFKSSMRGYDKKEVDEFLDDIIKDYETYSRLEKEVFGKQITEQIKKTMQFLDNRVVNIAILS